MTLTPPRVQIVNKPTSPHTGIGRFALEIERGLIQRGIMLSIAPLHDLVPRPVTNVVKKFGLDLDAFFKSYPLRVDARQGHVTHLTSQSLGILLLTQRFSRPVVVTVHDILPYLLRDDQQLNVYGHHAQRIMDALAMRGLRRADRLTADSLFTKSTLMDALEIPETLIDVVPLGVDTSHFQPQSVPDSFRQKHQLPRDRVFALYVGTEDPRKNLPLLLRAIRQARETLPNLTLLKVVARPLRISVNAMSSLRTILAFRILCSGLTTCRKRTCRCSTIWLQYLSFHHSTKASGSRYWNRLLVVPR